MDDVGLVFLLLPNFPELCEFVSVRMATGKPSPNRPHADRPPQRPSISAQSASAGRRALESTSALVLLLLSSAFIFSRAILFYLAESRTTVSQDVQTRFSVQSAYDKFLFKIKGILIQCQYHRYSTPSKIFFYFR